jgi:predicted DNA-binding transcriptional regulator YafY
VGIPDTRHLLLEPVLEPDEWMLLSFLLNSGSRLAGRPELQSVLQRLRTKLAGVLADSSINQAQSEFARLFERLEPVFEYLDSQRKLYPDSIWETTVNPLAEATVRQLLCRVDYDSFHAGGAKRMDILPLRLVERNGSLYLLAMAAKYRNRILPLEIGRFRAVEVLAEAFELPELDLDGVLDSVFGIYIDEARSYRILFSQAVARHIRERQWAATQRLVDQPDGAVILEMETSGYPEVLHWVRSWGPEALVLEPAELRADILKGLRLSLVAYGD